MTDLEKLREMIESHHKIAFFGGAGVSTESHIPDFRGANGIYRQKINLPWTPEEMLSHHFMRNIRWSFSKITKTLRKPWWPPNRTGLIMPWPGWKRRGNFWGW